MVSSDEIRIICTNNSRIKKGIHFSDFSFKVDFCYFESYSDREILVATLVLNL